jgi:signal transduction histidine kinase
VLAGAYAVTAGAYVLTSNRVVEFLATTPQDRRGVGAAIGLGFVAATAVLWFVLAFTMMRRLERQSGALAAADRRALSGLLASAVAHDFKNVLQVADGFTTLAHESDGLEDARDSLAKVHEALARGAELARRLSQAGRDSAAGQKRRVALAGLVVDCMELLRAHANVRAARIEVHAETPLDADVHPAAIQQAVTNLVLNAVEASPKGRVKIDLARDGRDVVLAVDDDGPGVPESERQRIFDPFYTSKPDGTGLGLIAVRAAADLHGGSIEIATSALGGARFVVRLPNAVAGVEVARRPAPATASV